MGLCGAKLSEMEKQELARSKQIEKENMRAMKQEMEYIKLLLLGAGESGKSTIFKQMKILYGSEPYSELELEQMRPVIYNNVIVNMKAVVENAKPSGVKIADEELADWLLKLGDDDKIDVETGTRLQQLWRDEGVQEIWEQRAGFQVQDSLKYYCENLDRIMGKDEKYLPSVDDVLRARVRTSGIVEEKYVIDGVSFVMYDVGGQRNERKKWIHCFDNVTAVIFVAAISEYDQVLYEDTTQNRMVEACSLFEEICNSTWFKRTAMILFLNKRDLFEEKLFNPNTPLRVPSDPSNDVVGRNEDFEGPYADDPDVPREEAYGAAVDYMTAKFTCLKQQTGSRDHSEIYHHVTCATDTNNVAVVFNACKDIILRDNLKGSGFMEY